VNKTLTPGRKYRELLIKLGMHNTHCFVKYNKNI
jgi:hypothetical protein